MNARQFMEALAACLVAAMSADDAELDVEHRQSRLDWEVSEWFMQEALIHVIMAAEFPGDRRDDLVLVTLRAQSPQEVYEVLVEAALLKSTQPILGVRAPDDAALLDLFRGFLDGMLSPPPVRQIDPTHHLSFVDGSPALIKMLLTTCGRYLSDPHCLSLLTAELRECPPDEREELLEKVLTGVASLKDMPPTIVEFSRVVGDAVHRDIYRSYKTIN